MIRIHRGDLPCELTSVRENKLKAARRAKAAKQTPVFDGYQVARTALYEAQAGKCAYCERQQGLSGQPVEHFRPKNGAELSPGQVDAECYWWLAWEWTNLLVSCVTCNNRAGKGNHFPLANGSRRLPVPDLDLSRPIDPHCFDTTIESPLLIDPASEDPLDFIEWRPQPTKHDHDWKQLRWRPYHKDHEGKGWTTIQTILRFPADPDSLVTQVNHHIRSQIVEDAEQVRDLLAEQKLDQARKVWERLIRRIFPSRQPFHAASFDALCFFFDDDTRSKLGGLSRPGNFGAAQP